MRRFILTLSPSNVQEAVLVQVTAPRRGTEPKIALRERGKVSKTHSLIHKTHICCIFPH
jgi:hypothetical protein